MPPPVFHLFGTSHLIVLALTVLISIAMVWHRRRKPGAFDAADGVLVVALLLQWPASIAAHWQLGDLSIQNGLPLHFCDVAAFAGVAALMLRHQLAAEICYFFSLAGTLQGLITPALREDFPHLRFVAFFLLHSSAVITAIYLVAGWRFTPRPQAPMRMLGWVAVYGTSVAAINAVLRTNYGWVCEKPPSPSLMDVLGPWPAYVLALGGLGFVIFTLLDLPFISRRKLDLSLPSKHD